jgi:hypothetical protein
MSYRPTKRAVGISVGLLWAFSGGVNYNERTNDGESAIPAFAQAVTVDNLEDVWNSAEKVARGLGSAVDWLIDLIPGDSESESLGVHVSLSQEVAAGSIIYFSQAD